MAGRERETHRDRQRKRVCVLGQKFPPYLSPLAVARNFIQRTQGIRAVRDGVVSERTPVCVVHAIDSVARFPASIE